MAKVGGKIGRFENRIEQDSVPGIPRYARKLETEDPSDFPGAVGSNSRNTVLQDSCCGRDSASAAGRNPHDNFILAAPIRTDVEPIESKNLESDSTRYCIQAMS